MGTLVSHGARAAQIIGSEILLCTDGYSGDGSTCTSYDVGNCATGYYEYGANESTFVSPNNDLCSYSVYGTRMTLPDTIITLTYHGVILGDEITLCNNGYAATNATTCTSYAVGNCANGYYEYGANESTFVAPNNGLCSYSAYGTRATLPDTVITLTYHGVILGDEITLCNNGYAATNATTCTSYTAGNCADGYYDLGPDTTTFAATQSGTCATGYAQYIAEEACGYAPSESTCVNVCANGNLTTGIGTCAALCSLGATTLRTSNGVIVPLWSARQTIPSINIGFGSGICYANLITTAPDNTTIVVNNNGTLYYATK